MCIERERERGRAREKWETERARSLVGEEVQGRAGWKCLMVDLTGRLGAGI